MTLHDPVFHIGILAVHPFGLTATIGLIVAYVVSTWQVARARLTLRYLPGLFLMIALGSILLARAGFVAQHRDTMRHGLSGALSLWEGGFSLPLGIVGGALLLRIYTWSQREPFWAWGDALAPAAALGLAIGMLGEPYSNPSEGWGRPTNGPFFMAVDPTLRPPGMVSATRFHPIFAYEAILFVTLAMILLVWAARDGRMTQGSGSRGLTFLLVAMVGYAALRPLTLDASHPAVVLQTQVLCAVTAAVAGGALAARLWHGRTDRALQRELKRYQARSGDKRATTDS